MNWSLIGMLLLVLLIVIVISATAIFFIRHWANRATATDAAQQDNEGYFFTRYTPPGSPAIDQRSSKLRRLNFRKYTQYALSLLVIMGIVSLLGAATYYNRDKLAAHINLTETDLGKLQTRHYQWAQTDAQQLPELAVYLQRLRTQDTGLLLVRTPFPENWPKHAPDIPRQAAKQWLAFAEQQALKVMQCTLAELSECGKKQQDWIHILLPGVWDEADIRPLLQDKKLIAYGPPLQIYLKKSTPFQLDELSFKHALTTHETHLSLVADRELTLGFDAGMIIEAQPAFKHYQTESARPQGISINPAHLSGGHSTTRLFAKPGTGQGRFVWMDFSPNDDDHEDIVPYYLHSVLAAIFRYLDGKPYSALANWPQAKTFAALLEEDTEDEYDNAYRVAEYFKEKNYPITWYALSNEAQENRELTRFLATTGEIACHGDNHMDFPLQDLEMQHRRIARCRKVMHALTGQHVVSFRPPREEHNTDTYHAMAGNGIRHFIAEVSGDRFTPIAYSHENDELALISIPRMNSDDYLLWDELELSDKESIDQLKQEVDWIKHIGGLFMFSFHSQYMGSHKHLQTVKELADYIHSQQAFFATTSEVAEWWRFRIRLTRNKPADESHLNKLINQFHPVLLIVNENGRIQQQVIKTSQDVRLIKTKEQP